ncbi:MAG: hypothetical protein ACREH8_18010 [Opitutaceae bacterium]
MKFTPLIAVVIACGLAACESLSDATTGVRDRMAARSAPQTRTYEAPQRQAYEAVRATAKEMGYRFIRGGPAQGELEAISRVGSGETLGSARQIAMKVALKPTLDGKGTDVAIRLTEIIEADSSNRAGQATETPLRNTPQYDVFFRRVGQVLGVAPIAGP